MQTTLHPPFSAALSSLGTLPSASGYAGYPRSLTLQWPIATEEEKLYDLHWLSQLVFESCQQGVLKSCFVHHLFRQGRESLSSHMPYSPIVQNPNCQSTLSALLLIKYKRSAAGCALLILHAEVIARSCGLMQLWETECKVAAGTKVRVYLQVL